MDSPLTRFIRAYPPALPQASGKRLVLGFSGSEAVFRFADNRAFLCEEEAAPDSAASLYLGTLDGVPVIARRLPDGALLPDDCRTFALRALYGQVDDTVYGLAGYASQLLHWWEEHRFCVRCGGQLEPIAVRRAESSWGKECANCGRAAYPPVVPAVLLLIHDGGDRLLLVSKPGWGQRHSIVAGFVEPGETLEECCSREAMEEVGVAIGEITYSGSQTWPFPHQIMIGFTARYRGGEIRLDLTELEKGGWFHRDALPDLPPTLSLSRQLIDSWIAERQ